MPGYSDTRYPMRASVRFSLAATAMVALAPARARILHCSRNVEKLVSPDTGAMLSRCAACAAHVGRCGVVFLCGTGGRGEVDGDVWGAWGVRPVRDG